MSVDPRVPTLQNALRAMLVGTDKTLPEAFPGHTESFLRTVAIPRAIEALAMAGMLDGFSIDEIKSNAGEAAVDGFLFGRDRKQPVVHELVAGLDDGPSWCPEEWYELPFCRMVYAIDRGDPSVGIPARSSFVLAEDQAGTVLKSLVELAKNQS